MTAVKASDFPQLRRVFSGYFHEDFLEEYGTPLAAVRAFQADANASERRRFGDETRKFLDRTATLDFDAVRTLLNRLGSRWTPASRSALEKVLTAPPT